jgi:hypothetical protein
MKIKTGIKVLACCFFMFNTVYSLSHSVDWEQFSCDVSRTGEEAINASEILPGKEQVLKNVSNKLSDTIETIKNTEANFLFEPLKIKIESLRNQFDVTLDKFCMDKMKHLKGYINRKVEQGKRLQLSNKFNLFDDKLKRFINSAVYSEYTYFRLVPVKRDTRSLREDVSEEFEDLIATIEEQNINGNVKNFLVTELSVFVIYLRDKISSVIVDAPKVEKIHIKPLQNLIDRLKNDEFLPMNCVVVYTREILLVYAKTVNDYMRCGKNAQETKANLEKYLNELNEKGKKELQNVKEVYHV